MSLDNLQTLDDAIRRPRACAKGPSMLEQAEAQRKAEDRAWEKCKKAVDKRDGVTCRICGRATRVTPTLCNEQADHAHIARRSKEVWLKTDARNVFKACRECHEKLDQHKLHALQKAKDNFKGPDQKNYINADNSISFVGGAK